MAGQCRVRGQALGHRKQGGQAGHRVRRRTQRHGPLIHSVARAPGDRLRVPPVRRSPDCGDDGPVPGAGQGPGVGGDLLIHGGPVLDRQAGCFLHHQGGPPLVQLARFKRRERVGHLNQGFPQTQQPGAARWRLAPGQGNFRSHPGAEFIRRHTGRRLFLTGCEVVGHGDPCLLGRSRGLHVLQLPHLVDHSLPVSSGTDQRQGAQDIRNNRPRAACRFLLPRRRDRVHKQSLPAARANRAEPPALCK